MSRRTRRVETSFPEVVEFFGLPGSGKTSVSLLVVEALRGEGLAAISSQDYVGDSMSAGGRNFRRIKLLFRELPFTYRKYWLLLQVFATPQRLLRDRFKAVYNLSTIYALLSMAKRNERLLVLDQGLLQATWSFCLFARDGCIPSIWLERLLPEFPHKWTVIVLEADSEVRNERLETRATRHSRLQLEGDLDRSEVFVRAEMCELALRDEVSRMAQSGRLVATYFSTMALNPMEISGDIVRGLLTSASK